MVKSDISRDKFDANINIWRVSINSLMTEAPVT